MKFTHGLIALCYVMLLSCQKDGMEYASDYSRSLTAWQQFKSSSDNSYTYTVATGSWTGTGTKTTLTIDKGKITTRAFIATQPVQNGNQPGSVTVDEWTETGTTLGEHNYGAALLTLDDIYNEAKINWLQKKDGRTVYFEAKNNGMISSCGYVTDGCADDCFTGVTITEIKSLR